MSTIIRVGSASVCASSECKLAPVYSVGGHAREKRPFKALACGLHLDETTRFVVSLCGKAAVEDYSSPPPPRPSKQTIEELKKTHEIYACGRDPEDAIESLAENLEWGEVANVGPLEGGSPEFTWGRRFTANGTSMKAAGWDVPGGVVVAWWK